MTFQSTPSFRIPCPTSTPSSLWLSGTATPFPSDLIERDVDGPPAIDETEGERDGDGGGNALEGNRAIGRSRVGVDVPLFVSL